MTFLLHGVSLMLSDPDSSLARSYGWKEERQFLLRFTCLATVVAIGWAIVRPMLTMVQEVTAALVAFSSPLLGQPAAVHDGLYVRFGSEGHRTFEYIITDTCTGIIVASVFAIAVLAYPAEPSKKVRGLLIGIPVLLMVNVGRLILLGWIGLHRPTYFDTVHLFWGQAGHLLLAICGWMAWVWFVADKREPSIRNNFPDDKRTTSHGQKSARYLVASGGLTFGLLAVVGMYFGGIGLQRDFIEFLLRLFGESLWGSGILVSNPQLDVTTALEPYAQSAVVFTLLLVAPVENWRTRARNVLLLGVPAMLLLQAIVWAGDQTIVVLAGRGASPGELEWWASVIRSISLVMHAGIGLTVWQHWAVRQREQTGRRLAANVDG